MPISPTARERSVRVRVNHAVNHALSSWLSSLTIETLYPRASTSARGALRKLTCSPRVRATALEATLLHLRMRVELRYYSERCGRGGLSAQFQAGLQVPLSIWVRAYSGQQCRHVRLALCVRFTMIRNRSLPHPGVKRCSSRAARVRSAMRPSQLAPSTKRQHSVRRWLSFLMKVPSSLLGPASNDTADAELMPTLASVRSRRRAAFSNNAQDSRVSHQDHAYAIFLAVCQSDDCISSLLRRLKTVVTSAVRRSTVCARHALTQRCYEFNLHQDAAIRLELAGKLSPLLAKPNVSGARGGLRQGNRSHIRESQVLTVTSQASGGDASCRSTPDRKRCVDTALIEEIIGSSLSAAPSDSSEK